MQIVIDIPEEVYDALNKKSWNSCFVNGELAILEQALYNGTPLPKCNQCKYYKGIHNVQGHAPCEYHKIGGVLWNWYCSQFKADTEVENG